MKHDSVYLVLFAVVTFLLLVVAPVLHPISVIKSEWTRRKRQL
jgi:hypothetical protein